VDVAVGVQLHRTDGDQLERGAVVDRQVY
jgi:hypothetical protein